MARRAIPLGHLALLRSFTMTGAPNSITFAPDGKSLRLLSQKRVHPADRPNVIMDAGTIITTVDLKSGKTTSLSVPIDERGMDISPNGRLIAGVKEDYSGVAIWDGKTGRELRSLKLKNPVGMAFSPDNREVAVAESAGTDENTYLRITIRRTRDWKAVCVLPPSHAWWQTPRFSPNSNFLVGTFPGGEGNGDVTIWNLRSRHAPRFIDANSPPLSNAIPMAFIDSPVFFSKDYHWLAAGNVVINLRWSIAPMRVLGHDDNDSNTDSQFLGLAQMGRRLMGYLFYTDSRGSWVELWDIARRREVRRWFIGRGNAAPCTLSPNKQWFAGVEDKSVKLWRLR